VRVVLSGLGMGVQLHSAVNGPDALPQQQLLRLMPLDDRCKIVELAGLLLF
jgi:hypothetical protein